MERVEPKVGGFLTRAYDAVMAGGLLALDGATRASVRIRRDTSERLAMYPEGVVRALGGRESLWLHASSVGELRGISSLIEPMRRRLPALAVVVSTLTKTGQAQARDLPGVDAAVLFPLDARRSVRRSLGLLRPRLFLFSETELWPRFLLECAGRSVPCILVSGRVSERSMARYAWVQPLLERALANVTCCVQSEADRQRLIALGALPDRVTVAGSLKAEAPRDEKAARRVAAILERLGDRGRPLIVGASTHPGEEAALVKAFEGLRRKNTTASLLLAPRHPERFDAVARELDASGCEWVRVSAVESGAHSSPSGCRVLLLDSLGLLRCFFPYARLVFVGGTLAPVGGHNLLEPAADACAVLFGPFTDNVTEVATALEREGAGLQVASADALGHAVEGLMADEARLETMGRAAAAVAAASQGAVAKHLAIIDRSIDTEAVQEGP